MPLYLKFHFWWWSTAYFVWCEYTHSCFLSVLRYTLQHHFILRQSTLHHMPCRFHIGGLDFLIWSYNQDLWSKVFIPFPFIVCLAFIPNTYVAYIPQFYVFWLVTFFLVSDLYFLCWVLRYTFLHFIWFQCIFNLSQFISKQIHEIYKSIILFKILLSYVLLLLIF